MAEETLATTVAAKDRLIQRQAEVMDLAKGVLGSKDIRGAVRTLVETAYKVVDADRVFFFLVSKDKLICSMAPELEHVGNELPLGSGMAGHVAQTGEVLNLEDAYSRPDLFDATHDLMSGYTTRSVLCLPLRERDGKVIGVIQAINKSGCGNGPVPFEPHDERSLELLLALTSHQLHYSELCWQRQRATDWAESMLTLVEAISAERETDGVAAALARATVGLLRCRWALVFLRDQASSGLVCWAVISCFGAAGERGMHVELDEPVLGEVISNGMPVLLDMENHAKELLEFRRRLEPCFGADPEARSALCVPLPSKLSGENVGVLLALDRLASLGDAEEPMLRRSPTPPSPSTAEGNRAGAFIDHRRFSAGRAMRAMLRTGSKDSVESTGPIQPSAEARPFHSSDLAIVSVLARSAANVLRMAGMYERELHLNRRMSALMELITQARSLSEQKKPASLVAHVSGMGCQIFDCDRCTFFTLDNFNQQLVGFYVIPGTEKAGSEGESLQELRVPLKGIAGHVANTKEPLNIKDAWNDERFNRNLDMETGYRTKTILCAPVTATNGRMVGVIQCINKNGGRTFDSDDLEMLSMVSISLSDAIQQTLLDSSYEAFIRTNTSITKEVKDMFCFFQNGTKQADASPSPMSRSKSKLASLVSAMTVQPKLRRMLTRTRTHQIFLDSIETWGHDLSPLEADHELLMRSVRLSFDRLSIGDAFSPYLEKVGPFLQALKAKYSTTTSYHNWKHALTVWQATFLLLTSPAFFGALRSEEQFALILAAFGHDVQHPGTSNNFQVNSMSTLALRYNDISVLENHHAALTSSVLKDEGVTQGLEQTVLQRIRQVIVTSILHTDMVRHKENRAWLETASANLASCRESGSQLEPESGLKLCNALLHCADLVHPVMPWKVHRQMSILVAEEFYAQHQEEQRLGLPTLPFMGKDPNNMSELAPIQVGFLQFVAAPLWSALNFFAHDNLLNEVVLNVGDNKDRWQRIADGEDVEDDQPFRTPLLRPRAPSPLPSPSSSPAPTKSTLATSGSRTSLTVPC